MDAHALIWFLTGSPRLGPNALVALTDPGSTLYVPITVLAEACWIVEHGKTVIASAAALMQAIDADCRIVVVPMDRTIMDQSLVLTAIGEMHDRQIVATALRLGDSHGTPPLITCDCNITTSGAVAVVW